MKWIIPGVVALALTATGCLPTWNNLNESDKQPVGVARSAPPAPPVTADTVTEKNAHEKARELREEMNREAARSPAPSGER